MSFRNLLVVGACALAAVVACGGEDEKESTGGGAKNSCPDQTFAKAAKPFLAKYCIDCHSDAQSDAKGGGHSFELEAELREHGHTMYEMVEDGTMPMDGREVDEDEKEAFLEWLECSGASAADSDHDHD